ncbi:hypothetical protein NDU88_009197 [Pleurodeles waltl]|uniref:Uncharacterized protein n=1 Tax=Pleurodeles waltl TaxID=8319 RepID=A0AAV7RZR0_PLEWA|nr:hypothetical protein NDU88_009197 [Pleurodeles waltl]
MRVCDPGGVHKLLEVPAASRRRAGEWLLSARLTGSWGPRLLLELAGPGVAQSRLQQPPRRPHAVHPSGALGGCGVSRRISSGSGRSRPAVPARESAPRSQARGVPDFRRSSVLGVVPPPDGTQAPQNSGIWSPGVRGYRGTLRVPVGTKNRISAAVGLGG